MFGSALSERKKPSHEVKEHQFFLTSDDLKVSILSIHKSPYYQFHPNRMLTSKRYSLIPIYVVDDVPLFILNLSQRDGTTVVVIPIRTVVIQMAIHKKRRRLDFPDPFILAGIIN